MQTIYVGTTFRSDVTFTDNGVTPPALVDPDTVQYVVQRPDGTKVTYTYGVAPEVVRVSKGVYYAEIPLGLAGAWLRYWNSVTSGKVGIGVPQRIQVSALPF